jgi:hypothetical protein
MRIVDPLLPQSSGLLAGLNPLPPIPSMQTVVGSSCVISTPSCLKHLRVDWQSWLVEKLVRREAPWCASAAMIAARCEMDLSPGTRRLPQSVLIGETVTLELWFPEIGAVLILMWKVTLVLS